MEIHMEMEIQMEYKSKYKWKFKWKWKYKWKLLFEQTVSLKNCRASLNNFIPLDLFASGFLFVTKDDCWASLNKLAHC